ncbi:MAG: hypothetical protein PHV06_04365, partial [bacterium]|nr:hypothetical protein [bacterium]
MTVFDNPISLYILIPVFILLLAVIYISYRFSFLSPGILWVLRIMRIISFAILIFIILNPVLKKEERIIHPSNVIILLDTSLSMSLKDQDQKESRFDLVLDYIRSTDFVNPKVRDNYAFHFYRFDEDLYSVKERDLKRLKASGKGTGIINALKKIKNEGMLWNISGILIFSDGIENVSSSITEELTDFKDYGIPVISYGVGGFYSDRDAAITSAEIPEIFYRDESTEILFDTEFRNLEKQEVKIEMLLDNKMILEKKYSPESDFDEKQFNENLALSKEGQFILTVKLTGDFIEDNPRNNLVKRSIVVRKPRYRVLYLEFSPGWDYSFLKRILKMNKRIDLESYIFDSKGRLIIEEKTDAEKSKALFDEIKPEEFDLVIIGNPGNEYLDKNLLRKIKSSVNKGKSGLVLLFGSTSGSSLELFEEILPFNIKTLSQPRSVRLQITDDG